MEEVIFPAGTPVLAPFAMGSQAVLVRLTYPPDIDSHAQLSPEVRYQRMLLARALQKMLVKYQNYSPASLVIGYDSVLITSSSPTHPPPVIIAEVNQCATDPAFLADLATGYHQEANNQGRLHRIPVLYGGTYGLDLEEIARLKGLSLAEVIAIHCATTYEVYLVGFAAGYAYMGSVDPRIDLPRRAHPRTKVLRQSVAVAAGMTGIYPLDMPGGWNLLGATPYPVFDFNQNPPVRFLPGDRVQFFPIEASEWAGYTANLELTSSLSLVPEVVT